MRLTCVYILPLCSCHSLTTFSEKNVAGLASPKNVRKKNRRMGCARGLMHVFLYTLMEYKKEEIFDMWLVLYLFICLMLCKSYCIAYYFYVVLNMESHAFPGSTCMLSWTYIMLEDDILLLATHTVCTNIFIAPWNIKLADLGWSFLLQRSTKVRSITQMWIISMVEPELNAYILFTKSQRRLLWWWFVARRSGSIHLSGSSRNLTIYIGCVWNRSVVLDT